MVRSVPGCQALLRHDPLPWGQLSSAEAPKTAAALQAQLQLILDGLCHCLLGLQGNGALNHLQAMKEKEASQQKLPGHWRLMWSVTCMVGQDAVKWLVHRGSSCCTRPPLGHHET